MKNRMEQYPDCNWVRPNRCKSNIDGKCKCLMDTDFPKREFCPFYKLKKGEEEICQTLTDSEKS